MDFDIKKASISDSQTVSELVTQLLLELAPDAHKEIEASNLGKVAHSLMLSGEIVPLLALKDGKPVGVLTLSESAAVYAGGMFGIISELYVVPKCRSAGIGGKLLHAARKEATDRNWKRLEVGAPDKTLHPGSYNFYLENGFNEIGPRLRIIVE